MHEISFKQDVIKDRQRSDIYLINHKKAIAGVDSGGGGGRTRRAPPPLKLEKNMNFWRKIVIFHTKYPNNFRASLRSAQFF
jgi:hypothetical protein